MRWKIDALPDPTQPTGSLISARDEVRHKIEIAIVLDPDDRKLTDSPIAAETAVARIIEAEMREARIIEAETIAVGRATRDGAATTVAVGDLLETKVRPRAVITSGVRIHHAGRLADSSARNRNPIS